MTVCQSRNVRHGGAPCELERIAALEEDHFWFLGRRRLIVDTLGDCLPAEARFLEIGCRTGSMATAIGARFPEMMIWASELDPDAIAVLGSTLPPEIRLVRMDARCIPFEDEFDAVGAFDVVEHIVEDETALAEIRRALRPGGAVVLTVPQHRWLWSALDEASGHARRYRRGELEAKLAEAGFRIVHSTSFVTLLLPLMFVSRRLGGRRLRSDGAGEFHPPPWLNRMLGRIMDIERRLIGAEVRLPFGGSRLVVARKD